MSCKIPAGGVMAEDKRADKAAFLQEMAKTQKGQMKEKLWEWGGTLDLCKRKHDQIRKLQRLLEDARSLENCAYGRGLSSSRLTKGYIREMERLGEMAEELLQKKAKMDLLIQRLAPEEQEFLFLRYEKGYGYDYIAMKTFMSRAQCFRIQEKALKALVEMEEEEGTETF